MNAIQNIFQKRKADFSRLRGYGFAEKDGMYTYSEDLPECGFLINIAVTAAGVVLAEVIDPAFSEPYTLHLTEASGAFISTVRREYEHALRSVADACFTPDVFCESQACELCRHIREVYGTEPEYLWPKLPGCAALRRSDTRKWYGVLMKISSAKLGILPAAEIEIIDLRLPPEQMPSLIDGKKYFPGWHMNKKHWYTLILNGSVPLEELFRRVEVSYHLAVR